MTKKLQTFFQALSFRRCIIGPFIGMVMLLGLSPILSFAQPLIGAKNLALGGGGTAYLTGVEANFYNPANLMIYDREGSIHFSVASGGFFFEPVLSDNEAQQQAENFRDIFSVYRPGSQQITSDQRDAIIRENYLGSNAISQHQAYAEVLLGGIQWQKADHSFSLVARSRYASRIEVGSGWYSTDFKNNGNNSVRDFTLIRQNQTLHEISFAYAREFDFINGLLPKIRKLYIGIAPKFIIGGAYSNAVYDARYVQTGSQPQASFVDEFSYRSSGSYSDMVRTYSSGAAAQQAINNNLSDDFYLNPTGYGFGFDFGLTYVIPLQSNTAIYDTGKSRRTVDQSLRFAFSVTDLGFITYTKSPFQIYKERQSQKLGTEGIINSKFIGSAGQYLSIFENASVLPNPFLTSTSRSGDSFTQTLPTSLNTGFFLDLSRIKISGDLTLALKDNAFKSTKLTGHFGLETHPHPNIPIRVGTQLATGLPIHLGLGTGVETRYWDFFISTQVLVKSSSLTTELIGGALAGLQFHL
ncbi:MAG: DUF5723 family protein [Balneolaceae bacterium]|nr:DUF5723 family protein [Balneolaceae bacterium]